MKPASQLTGQRFERLTVLSRVFPNHRGNTRWRCRCDCGAEVVVKAIALRRGETKSCGCLRHDRAMAAVVTHGMSRTRTYRIWFNMRRRCSNRKDKAYHRYGGRGIRVCDRWQDFASFFADMGEAPNGMTLERVDNDGNYEPTNCRWATRKEQGRNTSSNIIVELNGETLPLASACERLNVKHQTVYMRMRRGASFEEAVATRPEAIRL